MPLRLSDPPKSGSQMFFRTLRVPPGDTSSMPRSPVNVMQRADLESHRFDEMHRSPERLGDCLPPPRCCRMDTDGPARDESRVDEGAQLS